MRKLLLVKVTHYTLPGKVQLWHPSDYHKHTFKQVSATSFFLLTVVGILRSWASWKWAMSWDIFSYVTSGLKSSFFTHSQVIFTHPFGKPPLVRYNQLLAPSELKLATTKCLDGVVHELFVGSYRNNWLSNLNTGADTFGLTEAPRIPV